MTRARVGTRGSELALRQTRWVCDRLRAVVPEVEFEEVVIRTHGDARPDEPLDADFPPDGFVSAIEKALLAGHVDFAVHSYKDLPTAQTAGLLVAAVPTREAAHDVLVSSRPVELHALPPGLRVGTASPRRGAQISRIADVIVVPIRGNVPTRVAKVRSGELDAVILAAAGIRRLGLVLPEVIDLPIEQFVPAPAQGALAVQARVGDAMVEALARLDDPASRRAVEAERAFLRALDAGCRTPVGAHATVAAGPLRLHGQVFTDDGLRWFEAVQFGDEPRQLGAALAAQLSTFRDG